MPVKLATKLMDSDPKLVARAADGFVPRRVFDLHAHFFHSRNFAEGKRMNYLAPDTGCKSCNLQLHLLP